MKRLFRLPKSGRNSREQVTQPGSFSPRRLRVVRILVLSGFFIVGLRAAYLHLMPVRKESLANLADHQYQQSITLAPYRGGIFDRRGDPLAISIRKPSIAVNPRLFSPTREQALRLSKLTQLPLRQVLAISKKKSYFTWMARQIDMRSGDEIKAMEIPGLMVIPEPARFYPSQGAAGALIGFTGLDNNGLAGLERQYDRDLKGKALRIIASRDARGQNIFNETTGAAPEKTGNSVHLTIDRVIQEITEDELQKGVRAAGARKGVAVVTDPHTGKILALANYPGFDPNNARRTPLSKTRNHAQTDIFEPGSITKQFIIAGAIDKGRTSVDEVHDCENGLIRIGRDRVHDTHPASKLTTADTLVRSSNICTYKIALKLGKEGTFDILQKFGFGRHLTQTGFPGETTGYIANWSKWKPIRFTNVAFGHGFVINALEIAMAMGAIANGGTLLQPGLVERVVSSDGIVVSTASAQNRTRVIKPTTARTVRNLLEKVVTDPHGTGTRAAMELYTSAGKTGTAQKVDPGIKGYAKDKYIASFIGFAPTHDPYLVAYILIDEPTQKPYYGGRWAAPVFAAIADRALRYLNVAPDKQPAPEKSNSPSISKKDGKQPPKM